MPFQTKTAIKIDSIQAPTWFVKFNINPLSCFHLHLRYQTESQALEKFSVEVAASQKRAGTQVHNPACSSKLDRARMDQRKPCALFAASMAWWRLMNAALRKSCGGMNNRMWSPGASFQLPCQNSEVKAKSCTGGVARDPLKAANIRGAGNSSSPWLWRAASQTPRLGIASTLWRRPRAQPQTTWPLANRGALRLRRSVSCCLPWVTLQLLIPAGPGNDKMILFRWHVR